MAEDEQALIAAAQRGSLDAFNRLVLAYQDQAFTLAYRIMGERAPAADAAQDAMITAFRRLSTYRGGSFRGWLLKITANQCYDELRRRKRRPQVSVDALYPDADDDPPLPAAEATPEQAALDGELQRAIQACIAALNPEQRLILVLSDVEGFNYQDISSMAGVQLGTVKSRLSRARAAVRDCLRAVEELLPADFRLSP